MAVRKPTFEHSEIRAKQKNIHLVAKITVPSVSLSASSVDRQVWVQNEAPVAGKYKILSFSSKGPSEERYRQSNPQKRHKSPYFSMSAVPSLALRGLNGLVHGWYHTKAEIVLQCNTWPDFPVSVVISRNFTSKSTQI